MLIPDHIILLTWSYPAMMNVYPDVPVSEFEDLVRIVRRLRSECPWDSEQTHQSIRHSLIEETYEVVEALDENNLDELKKELGDLLLHIVMHATIAEQAGEFALKDVVREISDKLVRRHPHIYGNVPARDAREVKHNWERLKMQEGRKSVLEGIPKGMPSLQRAMRVQERAAKVGFDWKTVEDVWAKVEEETQELKAALHENDPDRRNDEFGDFLFALVNYARVLHVNPENALRSTTEKFVRRFHFIEEQLKELGKTPENSSLEEMDGLWNEAKKRKV